MHFNYTFRGIDSTADITTLVDFMSSQALNYPNYDHWIQRSEPEIYAGYKQAVLAFSDSKLVANLLFQPHKELAGVLEIKNLRVHPKIRRRDFGHFMLKQVEQEARQRQKINTLLIDARASQKDVLELLTRSGYKEVARAPLYDSNEEDVVLKKSVA